MAQWFYGPDGASGVFEECPEGWVDHPCKLKPAKPVADALEVVTEALAAAAKFDHDHDGKPGGSLPKAKRSKKRG